MIIRNEIYRKLFDRKWIRENRPTFWTERNKKIALYLFSAVCLAVAAYYDLLIPVVESTGQKEATSLRLKVEAQAILSDAMAGTDIHAMQLSAAAFRILASNKSYGGLLETLTAQNTTRWIADSAAPIYAVAFSPDGKRIVSGSDDKTLRLWDAATGQAIGQPLKGHEGAVQASPSARTASASSRAVRTRPCGSGTPTTGQPSAQPLKGHEECC